MTAYETALAKRQAVRSKTGINPNAEFQAGVRFWSKVDRTRECWLWEAGNNSDGYGLFRLDGRMQRAHRVSYALEFGAIPVGMQVDHMCFTRACVNPAHLRLVTNAENGQNRASANSRNASGIRGVYWHKGHGKWRAQAMFDGNQHHIGYFTDIADAETAVIEWRKANMPFSLNDREASS